MSNSVNSSSCCKYLKQLLLPKPDSRKGENGKLLIVGGSKLFHSASRWSLEVASRLVDMVFYSSIPLNNKLIKEAKLEFWDGIVVDRSDVLAYAEEADCILIGPGMERELSCSDNKKFGVNNYLDKPPTSLEWQDKTQVVVNYLVAKYPTKKWVIDAGALQMIDPSLLNKNCIITPHRQELEILLNKISSSVNLYDITHGLKFKKPLSAALNEATVIIKGVVDQVHSHDEIIHVEGGNPGMTKGGTGDVLSGLVAGLYCNSEVLASAVSASYINKLAGDHLFSKVGPFFNATDLAQQIPVSLWEAVQSCKDDWP